MLLGLKPGRSRDVISVAAEFIVDVAGKSPAIHLIQYDSLRMSIVLRFNVSRANTKGSAPEDGAASNHELCHRADGVTRH
jgi:hypothetical protein